MNQEHTIIDPAFLRESNYSYVNYDDEELATVLCFSLARNKKDLILHQQRIELYAKHKNNELLYTALIDLFLALEDKGKDYKKRIMDRYNNKITIRQAIKLKKMFDTVTPAITHIKGLNESILDFGIEGEILSSNFM